jgi:GT2 family glycosyltransferase
MSSVSAAEPTTPRVSVIAPAYHSDRTVGAFLDGLSAQTFRDFESIVVNSSPGTRTRAIIQTRLPSARFVQSAERLFPHAARNVGAGLAHGSLLVFTDPDCVPARDWLERLVQAADAGHELVVGAVGLVGGDNLARAVHLRKYANWLPGTPAGPRALAPTANVLYSRRAWAAAGPFPDGGFSGDTVLSWRARERGLVPWFEPRAVVTHVYDEGGRFLRESYVRGADFARLRALHERRGRAWALSRVAALPVVPLLLLARTARHAIPAGWGAPFVRTAPNQLAIGGAWALGELGTHVRLLARGNRGL